MNCWKFNKIAFFLFPANLKFVILANWSCSFWRFSSRRSYAGGKMTELRLCREFSRGFFGKTNRNSGCQNWLSRIRIWKPELIPLRNWSSLWIPAGDCWCCSTPMRSACADLISGCCSGRDPAFGDPPSDSSSERIFSHQRFRANSSRLSLRANP